MQVLRAKLGLLEARAHHNSMAIVPVSSPAAIVPAGLPAAHALAAEQAEQLRAKLTVAADKLEARDATCRKYKVGSVRDLWLVTNKGEEACVSSTCIGRCYMHLFSPINASTLHPTAGLASSALAACYTGSLVRLPKPVATIYILSASICSSGVPPC
mgnify:CR=1 FL=1